MRIAFAATQSLSLVGAESPPALGIAVWRVYFPAFLAAHRFLAAAAIFARASGLTFLFFAFAGFAGEVAGAETV